MKNLLPCTIRVVVTLQAKHSSTYISIKNKTEFQHKHGVLHYGKSPEQTGTDDYIEEAVRSISEQKTNHKDKAQKFSHSKTLNKNKLYLSIKY